jgi:transposase
MHAHQQAAGLEKRLSQAETKLIALTPPRGRGKRQITDEATLVEAIDLVLTEQRVDGLLSVAWEKQVEQTTQYVGRGRGSLSRTKRVIQKTRYHVTHIARQEDTIAAHSQRFGWKAFVTNAGPKRWSLQDAVWCSRNAYRVERLGNRLKSRVHIAPLFVKRNEHIEGLTYLLTLGVRVLTVTEFVLRRSLETEQASLAGLHPENKQKRTDKPTAERILKAFTGVSLTIITHATGEEILRRLTPLSALQKDILQRLGLGASLYGQLEIQEMRN